MKKISGRILQILAVVALVVFLLPGCYETHYYHHYHHHTRPWYDRHHRAYPAGVDFNIDVRKR